jgi:hypothetical protein
MGTVQDIARMIPVTRDLCGAHTMLTVPQSMALESGDSKRSNRIAAKASPSDPNDSGVAEHCWL